MMDHKIDSYTRNLDNQFLYYIQQEQHNKNNLVDLNTEYLFLNEDKEENDLDEEDDNLEHDMEVIDAELEAIEDDIDYETDEDEEEEIEITEDIDIDINYEYELLNDDTDVDFMFNVEKLIENQIKDPLLNIVMNVINGTDRGNEYRWLPPKMKSDVRHRRYFIDDQGILKIHYQNGKDLMVLPPELRKAFLHFYHHNVGTHLSTTLAKELIKHYYWPDIG